jgi:hypothetical protein
MTRHVFGFILSRKIAEHRAPNRSFYCPSQESPSVNICT